MKSILKNHWFTILAGVMLLLAVLPIWPYGYFQLLRWVVALVALYNAYLAYESKQNGWVFIMGAIVILFNPLDSFHFEKGTWAVFNLIGAIIMFSSVGKINK